MARKSRKSFSLLACSLGLVFSAPPLFGQSFEELEARLRDHPALQALRQQTQAYREDAVAAVAWPDPVVSVGVNNFPLLDPSFRSYLPTNKALGISQQIPNRTERAARSERWKRRAAHNDAAEALQFARMRAELIVALVERRRIAEQVSFRRQQDSLYGELEQIVQGEIAAGRPVLFRLAEIDLQQSEIDRALADLEGEKAEVDARLQDLVVGAGNVPPPDLEPQAWSGNPDAFHAVRVARENITVADAGVSEAQAAWKPDWGLQVTYQQRDSGASGMRFPGDDWVSAAVTFSVPLWGSRSQAPALRAARAERESARNRHMAAARTAAARYAALDATRRAAEAAFAALQTKISAIREQVQAQRTRYESGIGDYSPVIDGELAELILLGRMADEQARRDRAVAQLNSLLVTS
ncbi:MAG: TolC family protein [Gammaproteobacteria bacterium]|nr:TolC family protein [Gammaproteobacteria bacterium]MYH34499.1 TolC family protein [Gammaproteobacteria bacterium]MYL00651.1 TolC family protein [Gammaproteobacteria bacterium]